MAKNILIWFVIILMFWSTVDSVMAQTTEDVVVTEPVTSGQEPPMRNIFLNVLWGSLAGGMSYMGLTILDDQKAKGEKYSFRNLSTQFVTGATYGGIMGLLAGVYLSLNGITFDSQRTRIAVFPLESPRLNVHGIYADRVGYQPVKATQLLYYRFRF